MESQETGNSQIEFMSKKLLSMNEKLDQLAQLAHQLVVQNKGNPKTLSCYNQIWAYFRVLWWFFKRVKRVK